MFCSRRYTSLTSNTGFFVSASPPNPQLWKPQLNFRVKFLKIFLDEAEYDLKNYAEPGSALSFTYNIRPNS